MHSKKVMTKVQDVYKEVTEKAYYECAAYSSMLKTWHGMIGRNYFELSSKQTGVGLSENW